MNADLRGCTLQVRVAGFAGVNAVRESFRSQVAARSRARRRGEPCRAGLQAPKSGLGAAADGVSSSATVLVDQSTKDVDPFDASVGGQRGHGCHRYGH
jgi:hypothetical protein